jgi:MFS transporter, MHS family, proline/betaine transporter
VEHAPAAKKGLFAAWLQASMGMSNILGALVALSVTLVLDSGQITRWGWRIPFLIGLLIAPVGLYLRRTLDETPQFLAEMERQRQYPVRRAPLVSVFRDHSRALLIGMGISTLWAVAVYVLLIFLPVFVQKVFHYSASQAFAGSLVEYVAFVLGCFGFGALSDHIGRKPMLAIGAAVLLVGVLPLFRWLDGSSSTATLIFAQGALGIMVSSFTGVAPTVLSGLFPTDVRATGVSLVYNCAITLFGGFAPAILTWFTANGSGSIYAPAWYLVFAAVPAIIAIAFLGILPEDTAARGHSDTVELKPRTVDEDDAIPLSTRAKN